MLLKNIMPYVACLALAGGCAGTGAMLKNEKPIAEFPTGYTCTNLSLQYMQAAYGVINGSITTIEPNDPLIFLFRPTTCNPNDERLIRFAEDADADGNGVVTYREIRKALNNL